MRKLIITAMLAAAPALAPALAAEPIVPLKPGANADLLAQHCAACHSADYIRTNAPFLSADGWKAEVTKMRAVFGAPIDDEDAGKIVAYLVGSYGGGK